MAVIRERDSAVEYSLPHEAAMLLAGACQFDAALRREVLASYLRKTSVDELIDLFAQFLGLANSVVQNAHDALTLYGIVDLDMMPQEAERMNLPTIYGALNGVMLARGIDQDALCAGCAFRLGTLANQSPSTTTDADWCGHPGEVPFMCHMDLDADDEPTKGCRGFAQLRAKRKPTPVTEPVEG